MKSIDELCPAIENDTSATIVENGNKEMISQLTNVVTKVVETSAEQTKAIADAITQALTKESVTIPEHVEVEPEENPEE